MMDDAILHPERASQIIDFRGIEYKGTTFTDLDALLEYRNRAYIIVEVKYGKKELPLGQKVAIERMVKDFGKRGKSAMAVIAEHHETDKQKSVYLSDCGVRSIYTSGERIWRKPKHYYTVKQIVNEYLKWVDKR